jgi:hypothetical protein
MPAKTSQFATPVIVDPSGDAIPLQRLSLSAAGAGERDEDWLQALLFSTPSLLPIEDIEPTFSGVIPLCREIETAVGPLDLLFINEQGLLTLVECKLWRNPEARRKVVGQILDYAQEISRWSYEDLDAAVRKASGAPASSLWERAKRSFDLTDEAAFVDRVSRYLRDSTFLLLIVGDGIRENTEQIGEYLKAHAGLSFTLGLVEQQLFALPNNQGLLVQPRILAKTVELGRLIVRTESSQLVVSSDAPGKDHESPVPRTLTEQVFIEEVAGTSALAAQLRQFFDEIKRAGLLVEPTGSEKSLKICTPRRELNLLTLKRDGEVKNYGLGKLPEGREYLAKLAALFPSAVVRDFRDDGWRTMVVKGDGALLRIEDVLAVAEPLARLLIEAAGTLDEIDANAPALASTDALSVP